MSENKINLEHMDRCPVPEAKPWLRPILIVFGWTCVALGAIGAITPGLPTTIFLIMAAWAFSRSSRRFHAWLYGHKYFGPVVSNWDNHRVIPKKAKIMAVSMMSLSLAIVVVFFAKTMMVPLIMAGVMLPAAIYIVTRASDVPEAALVRVRD
ncbi:MAG: YbaN family protein [Rhodospirillaceae bacterium]|nr:YbaN family protein [Rhodospirillaceae bacterium]MBT4588032.1 YbaN family protein [Rhodospirillaceae bacterium]MBT4940713.1 YbaN family protein [Rhodospirillaceae bacterium]MBT5941082.1 YbaN family protein [Rhodospirillaceae bacterium]MBT7268845.1 YbaN family protein [Rhodospirillaceae bacterium]